MGKIRDAARTRERIVLAAEKEFAAKGFAGARVEGIARRARIKKQLLYHYFASKEQLFEEILQRQIEHKVLRIDTAPQDPGELLTYHFTKRLGDLDWIRFLAWEAASGGDRRVHHEAERRQAFERQVEELHRTHPVMFDNVGLEPRLVLLAIYSLTTYPIAFPQITRMIMGESVSSERFQNAWQSFLREVGLRLLEARAKQSV